MKVLHVIDSLNFSGCARQLELVAPLLAARSHRQAICCLGNGGRWAASLRGAGIAVHELCWSRWFDPAALLRLRELVRQHHSDVIHAWRRSAVRALALAAPGCLRRVVVSAPLPRRGRLPWWDRWLLHRVRCLAVADAGEQSRCAAAGLQSTAAIVPRAAACPTYQAPPCLPVDAAARRIVCVGALTRDAGFEDAIWAMDILNHIYPEAHLLIAGSGPHASRLHRFAQNLQRLEQVHFLGSVDPVAGLLRCADVCWVPSRANVGRQVALEALAQGCAVIATDVPCLRGLVQDGVTGLVIPRADAVGLARRTHTLFRDPELRARLGSAAQAATRQRCDATRVASRWEELYRRIVTLGPQDPIDDPIQMSRWVIEDVVAAGGRHVTSVDARDRKTQLATSAGWHDVSSNVAKDAGAQAAVGDIKLE